VRPKHIKKDYLLSLALWQINSTEKLNASAKAKTCHIDCPVARDMIIITKQNRLTITVNAFFSDKYFFIKDFLQLVWIVNVFYTFLKRNMYRSKTNIKPTKFLLRSLLILKNH